MLFNKHKNFLNQQAILMLLKGNDDCIQQKLKLYLFIKHFMRKETQTQFIFSACDKSSNHAIQPCTHLHFMLMLILYFLLLLHFQMKKTYL